jgi:TonB-dependent siderophore receptor
MKIKRVALCVAVAVAALPLEGYTQTQAPGTVTSGTPASGTQVPATPGPATTRPSGTTTPIDMADKNYAQYLVDTTAARYPDLLQIDVHAAAPGAATTTIVAAKTPERVGRASDADDADVARTGHARIEINRRGDQNVEVALPLFDIYRQTVGAVEFTFRYPPGTDQDALLAKAAQFRDEMSRRILDAKSLTDPARLDARIEAHPYAQSLVDDTLARHPELEVMTVRSRTPRTGDAYVIIASNIGRIGKPADPEELAVLQDGASHSEVDEKGRRVEWVLPLLDAAGARVGILVLVFPYGVTTPSASLARQAEQIAAELRARIPTAAALDQGYPAIAAADERRPIEEYNKQELGNKQDLPMTKEVTSGQALQQSTQDGYSEAIKNVAGVQPTNSAGSSNDAFSIRGIKLNLFSNYRLDGGLPVAGVITNPTENKERVETLKGANALMFGVASPAGIINFVSKRAGPRDVTSFGIAGNFFGQYGGSLDVGRRFGSRHEFGVRVNASATHLENGVHDLGGDGHFESVGLDYRATSRLTFQADVEHYERHVPEQAGIGLLTAVNGVVPITRVPDPRNNLIDGWNIYSPRTTNVQARADFIITDGWTILAQAGQSTAHRHRNTVRIRNYDADTGAGGVVTVQPLTNDYRNTFYRTEILGHFRTWFLTHDLTVGASSSDRYSATYDVQNLTLTQRQNIFDPIVLLQPVLTKPGTANPPQDSKDTGLYTYDTITVVKPVKLLLGVRQTTDDEKNGTVSSTSHVTSPAYGALYDIRPTTTLFASYMEGLEAGTAAPANAANANVILPPAISKQKEIGIRDSFFRGLSISASWFDITRANAVIDPVSNIFAYNGDLSYKGVESTVSYDVTREWRVNFAVLRLKATQVSPLQPLINGKVPENTPKWNGNAGVTYRVPYVRGLSLRVGVKLISSRPVNPENQGNIPGYALYDAGLTYATQIQGKRVNFQLTGDNLSNLRYWNSVQTGTYGIGMDRSVRFSAKMDF